MKKIESILRAIKPTIKLETDAPLYAQPEFDSLAIIALVSKLEEEFSIEIFPEDLVSENFATVETIRALVCRNGGCVE